MGNLEMNLIENMADEFLDIREEEKEVWRVEDDLAADWCLDKIRESKSEYKRFEDVAKAKIQQIENVLKKEKEKMENETEFFEAKLREYFEGIEKSDKEIAKTQEKYRLPSGELVKKFPNPQFKRDDEMLAKWLEDNQMNEYIEVKKQAKWGELKKAIEVVGDTVILKDTGEIVEGVEVVERAPEFQVKI